MHKPILPSEKKIKPWAMKTLKWIVGVFLFLLLFNFILGPIYEGLETGRYQAINSREGSPSYMHDKVYILDTRTGKIERYQ